MRTVVGKGRWLAEFSLSGVAGRSREPLGKNIMNRITTTDAGVGVAAGRADRGPSRRRAAARWVAAMGLGLLIPLGTAGAALAQDTSTAAASHAASASRTTTPSYRFSLSSHTAAFDSVNIGANSTLTVTFTNTGAKALHPVSVTSGSSEFSLTGGTCAGAQVAAKGTCTYQATFTPTVAGAVTGSLQVLTAKGAPRRTWRCPGPVCSN